VPVAIGVLQKEHVVIGRVLSVMEDQVAAIDGGIMPRPELIDLIAGFFSAFADRRHHGKEERYLFPVLAEKKQVIRDGPVKVLLAEHESGRYFVAELRQAVSELRAGDLAAAGRIRRAMALYARMLRKHIAKEEEIVFVLTQALLSDEEMTAMAEAFAEVDTATGSSSLDQAAEVVLRIEELNRAPV